MLTYIMLLFIIPCCIGISITRFTNNEKLSFISWNIFFTNIMMNIIIYVCMQKSILNLTTFSLTFYCLYFIGSSLCGGISHVIFTWLKQKELYIFKKTTILIAFVMINLFVYFFWLLGEAGRQSFELFLYNVYTPVNTDVANFKTQLFALLFFMLTMSLCLFVFLWDERLFRHYHKKEKKKHLSFSLSLLLGMICISAGFPVYSFHLEEAYAYFNSENSFLQDEYVNPDDVNFVWPKKQRNLVFVFLESFESSSLSKELGGLNEVNLLPNLSKYMTQETSFSNHDEGILGGTMSMPLTTVTISGMITAFSGVNNQVPAYMGSETIKTSVPNIITLHDLLADRGYKESFMLGSYIDAYGIGPFYRAHGNTVTVGWDEKKASGELPEDYKVWWGFEDKKLYEYAQEDLTKLSQQEEPFFYTIATNDTHRIDGYTDPTCPVTSYSYPMQNAIACADYMVNDFITWLKQQPFYENTTVVIVGDHLAHKEEYVSSLQPQEDRRIFNLILNANSPETAGKQYNRDFWTADLFPTVLSSLGVEIEGNKLGLGVNLFSNEQTLIEQYGETHVSESLASTSLYYLDNFVSP